MSPLLPRWEPVPGGPADPRWEIPGFARVTTDGSCASGGRESLGLPANRGSGGWAAVVEDGSNGVVPRGRVLETTATRMEMLAVVEGLKVLPKGRDVLVVSDALIVEKLIEEHRRGMAAPTTRVREDAELYDALRAQLDRMGRVAFRYVRKRDSFTPHQRCHKIAGSEAKALATELGHLPGAARREIERERRRELREQAVRHGENRGMPAAVPKGTGWATWTGLGQ